MDVTDVLRDRMHEPAGLQRMVAISIAAHAVFITALVLAPGQWLGRSNDRPVPVMTISLGGGGGGPNNGGLTAAGGPPVQQQVTPADVKREPVRPPAIKTPEMTVPRPNTKPTKNTPAPPVKQAPEEARGHTPTRGAQTSAGSAVADTGIRGQGFGLSTGGGPGSGSTLDVADFCCPDYLMLMIERIRSVWDQNQSATGQSVVRFTIERDGKIVGATVERSSGNAQLDFAAQRAVAMTRQLPPLPAAFPNSTLTVHLNFQYQR